MKQSFAWWGFSHKAGLDPDRLLASAAKIGYQGVDFAGEELWPKVQRAGLTISAIGAHGTLEDGMNRRENRVRIEKEVRANIAKAENWKIPVLICLSGNRGGLSDKEGLDACAEILGKLAPVAANAGVVLAMELLNSKVDHPDYQCDHTAWGVELCRRVGSPAVKLLYDVYHMQIMEGDLIRTIQADHAFIGHYHTAGNPGRGQPDETQEIFYPAVYRAIAKTGFSGFIAHEFWAGGDPVEALEKAFRDCEAALSK